MRPLTCLGAFVILASVQPIADPITNDRTTFGTINHLFQIMLRFYFANYWFSSSYLIGTIIQIFFLSKKKKKPNILKINKKKREIEGKCLQGEKAFKGYRLSQVASHQGRSKHRVYKLNESISIKNKTE